MRGTLSKITPKSLMVCTTTESMSSSYILDLCGELRNKSLFSRRPANKRRSEKMASIRSALSVNPTHRKISIRKANKIKQRKSRILNPKLRSVFEVPEDSLNCCPI
jgi:predicted metalloprotease